MEIEYFASPMSMVTGDLTDVEDYVLGFIESGVNTSSAIKIESGLTSSAVDTTIALLLKKGLIGSKELITCTSPTFSNRVDIPISNPDILVSNPNISFGNPTIPVQDVPIRASSPVIPFPEI